MTSTNHRPFTPEEDEQILEWDAHKGSYSWTKLSEQMKNRTPRQLKERFRFLAQGNNMTEFTFEEKKELRTKVMYLGRKWIFLSTHFFPNHSPWSLRRMYELIKDRIEVVMSNGEKFVIGDSQFCVPFTEPLVDSSGEED